MIQHRCHEVFFTVFSAKFVVDAYLFLVLHRWKELLAILVCSRRWYSCRGTVVISRVFAHDSTQMRCVTLGGFLFYR